MAEISWIKLSTGLPDNRKIKRIRNLPDGDKVILFWVFLLARAGESNKQGGLYFTETLPYTPEDMAIDFDFTLDVVNFSLITLEKFGMIETYDQVIFIKNWEEYQAVESMEKIREQTRLRVSRHREQKKKLTNGNVTCNADVTESNATDIDKELDIDIDKERDKEKIPFKEIIDYLNEKAGKSFKNVETHKKMIRARWNEGQCLDDFKKVVDNMVANWTGKTFDGKPAETYLQPSTLFGNKFDQYLNQVPKVEEKEVIYDDGFNF
ncbi:phage replisome organizer N-terminal domain-containing protein [Carnobacterium maltaromaticum]|uniref:phage replisome organizer N-terminal domain-containing protein n=2 Tax=Carnobacterium maltaromaticum TaxID=2751 RepID=UPI00298B42A3|nr:phage replisome organizer N-terminal domain-containing protein [Carnobacterium maltaromaticum]MDW5522116.1 phage replisome organizer N-terminal domain-containing protein [Carnobacterium maltaromaticum]